MSKEAFETVIGKAMLETEFRCLLLADPDQALASFGLTEEETSILKKIDNETLEVLSGALDARLCVGALEREPRVEKNFSSAEYAGDNELIHRGQQASNYTGKTGPLELLRKILHPVE